MHAAVVHAATGCTCAKTETAKKLSFGGEGDLLRTAMALLMRPVGMGRVSGLGDAATAGQAKPAAMWSADRRLPPLLAAGDVRAGEAILLRLWALLAVRSCAAAAVGERACLVGNLPPDCGLL